MAAQNRVLGRIKQDYVDCYSYISLTMDLFALAKHSKNAPAQNLAGEEIDIRDFHSCYSLGIHGAFEQAFFLLPLNIHGDLASRITRKNEIKSLSAEIISYAMAQTRGHAMPLNKFNSQYTKEEILFTLKKAKHFCIMHMALNTKSISDGR